MQTEEASTTSGSNSSADRAAFCRLALLWTSPSRASIRNFDISSLAGFMTNWNGNPCDRSPLESRTASQRGCDDETSDLAWRGGYLNSARSCRPGVGAARHYQSRLVRPVLSERKLPKLRARKPLLELWLAASRTSSRRGLSLSPPPLALMRASLSRLSLG